MQEWALLGELSRHPVVAAEPLIIRPFCPENMMFMAFSSSFAPYRVSPLAGRHDETLYP
jgi:hypothetical protein